MGNKLLTDQCFRLQSSLERVVHFFQSWPKEAEKLEGDGWEHCMPRSFLGKRGGMKGFQSLPDWG